MATKQKTYDWGGITLIVDQLKLATKPGQSGTASTISSTELEYLDGITAGTTAASKAWINDASGNVDHAGTLDVTGAVVFDSTLRVDGAIDVNAAITGDGGGAITGMNTAFVADGTTVTLTAADVGKTIVLDSGAACAVTLPNGVAGMYYNFIVPVTTHSATTITCDASDFFDGTIVVQATDTDAAPSTWTGDGAADDVLTLNGTTTGGIAGSFFSLHCVANDVWTASGYLLGSGTLADVFSAP